MCQHITQPADPERQFRLLEAGFAEGPAGDAAAADRTRGETRRLRILRTGDVITVLLAGRPGAAPGAAAAVWGYRPGWEPDRRRGLANARGETVARKPWWKEGWAAGRAVAPAWTWYERDRRGTWYRMRRADGRPVLLAAVTAPLAGGEGQAGGTGRCAAILTGQASGVEAQVHHRRPLRIPNAEEARAWLETGTGGNALTDLLAGWSARDGAAVTAEPRP